MTLFYVRSYIGREAPGESATPKLVPPNSFFKKVRPILLILRAFGRFPYGMTKEGILPFSFWSMPAIYCLAIYIGSIYFSVQAIKMLIQEYFLKSKVYNDKLLIFILISFLSHNFVVPITFWLPSPRLVMYIECWSRFVFKYEKEFQKLRNPHYVQYLSIISIPSAFVHIIFVVWILLEARVSLTLVFYPVVLVAYMTMILWFTSLNELQLQAKALRCNISKEERLSDLDNVRRCWATISHLTTETGHSQGTACGFLSLTAFVSYLFSIYGFFSSILAFNQDVKVQWQLLVPLTFYTAFFYFMFDRGERTSKEVGAEFISTILKIRDTQPCQDDNDELSIFLLTMNVGQPKLTFTGFTIVNRGLIKSLLSNTLTFLLVLIQFKS